MGFDMLIYLSQIPELTEIKSIQFIEILLKY